MKTMLATLLIISLAGTFVAMAPPQGDEWSVPEAARKMKNPVSMDDETMMIGKMLYDKHCKSCHGKEGEGDGPKSEELETFPGDFTTAEFQQQTDGTLFYKTSEGRDDMPEFKKKIPSDEDRWILVHYMRSLKK